MVVPNKIFSVEGVTRSFEVVGDSGRKIVRHFCPNCGSSLFTKAQALSNDVLIAAGTLDDAQLYKPAKSIHVDSRVHWDYVVPSAQEV